MPLIKSAIKRVKQDKLKRARNNITKRDYKELIKNFIKNITVGAIEEAQKLFPSVQKAIDTAAKKNILHKNNAANKKSRLSRMLNTPEKHKAVAKTTQKKSAEEKAPAKKVVKKVTKKSE